jgi:hypothetical protein
MMTKGRGRETDLEMGKSSRYAESCLDPAKTRQACLPNKAVQQEALGLANLSHLNLQW